MGAKFLHLFISPKAFFHFSQKSLVWLYLVFFICFTYGVISGLFFAPADYVQGEGVRIMYVHVPAAFMSLLIYMIMSAAAILGLVYRLKLALLVMRHSIILGASFTLLALVTGSLWAKPMWGTYWIWDARLSSELILFFIYLSIYILQSALEERQRGERAVAILILVGLVDLPIIHFSVDWWHTLHQGATFKLFSASSIDPAMRHPLYAMMLAFLFFYTIVLFLKMGFSLAYSRADYIRENNIAESY